MFLLSFFPSKHRLERRYTTGMVGVSYGNFYKLVHGERTHVPS